VPLRLIVAIALGIALVGGAAMARTSHGHMPRIHLSRLHTGVHGVRHTGRRSSGRRMHAY
jgi:hypothetical protein